MAKYPGIKGKGLVFILFLWFLWFLNYASRTIFSPIMPLIEDEFLISHTLAGSIFASASTGYGISVFLSGIFASFFGSKRSVIVSLWASALIFFFIPQAKSFSHLTTLVFALGMAAGIYLPSIIPIITGSFEETSWGKAIAIHDSGTSVSVFGAPLIATFLLGFLPWQGIFYVFGSVYTICGVLFFFACSELKAKKELKGYIGSLLSSILTRKSLWILSVVWIFAAGAFWAVYMIIPLYLTKELGLDISYANTIFGVSRIGGVVVAVMTGFVIDRYSLKKTMFIILSVSGIFMLFISHWNIRVIEIALFLQGSLIAGFFPIGLVSLSRMFEKEKRSMATGFIATLSSIIGAGLFPYLLGLSGDFVSFRFGIFAFGVLAILSSGLIYFIKEID